MTGYEAAQIVAAEEREKIVEAIRDAVRLEMKNTCREVIDELRSDDDLLGYKEVAPLIGRNTADAARMAIDRDPTLKRLVHDVAGRPLIRRGSLRVWLLSKGIAL